MSNPLWNRRFILWLVAVLQSQFGAALASLALSFLVLHQTGQAGQMAYTLGWSLLPNLFGPLLGVWIDRFPLKVPLIGADLVRGLVQVALALLAFRGDVPLWLINTLACITGFASVVAQPSAQAAVPRLVAAEHLARANGLMGSAGQVAALAGSFLGGWLIAALSPASTILVGGIAFLGMALVVSVIQMPSSAWEAAGGPPASFVQELRSGFQVLRGSGTLLAIPVLAFFLNAVVILSTVTLPKSMVELGAGSVGYGTLAALMSMTMILGGLLQAVSRFPLSLRTTSVLGFFLMTLGFALMAWQSIYPVFLIAGLVMGLAVSFINVPLFTLIQQLTPRTHLGRVFSVVISVGTLGMPLVLFGFAPLLDRMPMSFWFSVSALGMLLCSVLWGVVSRSQVDSSARPDL